MSIDGLVKEVFSTNLQPKTVCLFEVQIKKYRTYYLIKISTKRHKRSVHCFKILSLSFWCFTRGREAIERLYNIVV